MPAVARLTRIAGALRPSRDGSGDGPSSADVVPAAGGAPPRLLSDGQVQSFIRDGFLLVPQTDLPPAFHDDVFERCKAYWQDPERPAGREYFLAVPQLTEVLRTPATVGALTSLLGPNYVQHPHRTMHTRAEPVGDDQDWCVNRPCSLCRLRS